VSLTPVENKKIFNRKVLNILFGHLWGCRVNKMDTFFFKFTLRCKHSDIVPFTITTGINDTSNIVGKFTSVSLIPVVHLDLGIFVKKFTMILVLFSGA
jgi:hypothetical protein